MINTRFELYKLERELKRNGITCVFKREETNPFGEPDPNFQSEVCEVQCLYHEQNSNIQIVTGETTQTRTKKIPMLLCKYEDVAGIVEAGDFIMLNNKRFNVVGIVNILEWNILGDISLEFVDEVNSNGI